MAGNYCTRMEKLLSLSSSTEFLEQLSGGVEESRRRRRDIIPLPLFDRSINNNLRVRVEKSRVSWKGERERERVVFLDRARHFYIQRFHSLVYLGRGRFARWDRRLKRVARRRATGRMGGIANCPFPSIYTRSLTTRYVPWIGRIFEKRGRERETGRPSRRLSIHRARNTSLPYTTSFAELRHISRETRPSTAADMQR